MHRRSMLLALGASSLAGTLRPAFAQTTPPSPAQITGAGATFPAPLYQKWAEAVKGPTGIALNYQSIGSGAGQAQIRNRTVDIGASDAPMATDLLAKEGLMQFPATMGSLVAIVNVPGITDNQIKLSGDVLADIYLGKITKWNDPRIVEHNKGVEIPNLAIAPVYRADGSGTTYVWVSYLAAVSPEWKEKVGIGTSVKWPVGNGARGNEGVASTVRNTRGAIGYVENAYAIQNKLVSAQLRNRAGNFVKPEPASFLAAAETADWSVPNFSANLVDTAGAAAWPIVSPTFIIMPLTVTDATRAANVLKFFDWAFKNGDAIATELEYIPLPAAVEDAVRKSWQQIKGPDGKAVWLA